MLMLCLIINCKFQDVWVLVLLNETVSSCAVSNFEPSHPLQCYAPFFAYKYNRVVMFGIVSKTFKQAPTSLPTDPTSVPSGIPSTIPSSILKGYLFLETDILLS